MKNFFTHKMRERSPMEIVGMIILGVIAIIGLAILFGFVIMWLWNWLMPEIFDLPELTYWKSVGLFILIKLLVGFGGSSKSNRDECSSRSKNKDKSKASFSKWEHYNKFWEEEGDILYKQYIDRKVLDVNDDDE